MSLELLFVDALNTFVYYFMVISHYSVSSGIQSHLRLCAQNANHLQNLFPMFDWATTEFVMLG